LRVRRAYNSRRSGQLTITRANNVTADVHRFEELIAGRSYLIEVAPVAQDRWRAYIVRLPGIPTALMPFYGTTPVEAAGLLRDWLSRAHRRASAPAGSV
jgi:IS1 family transposase